MCERTLADSPTSFVTIIIQDNDHDDDGVCSVAMTGKIANGIVLLMGLNNAFDLYRCGTEILVSTVLNEATQ